MVIPDSQLIQVIAGPTASGKSALAMDMAARSDAVIVNADSMQIYDALPLLTAQPDAATRSLIDHRLYGALHPNDICSAARWADLATETIRAVLAKGRTPLLVGGTGLYLNSLMRGLSPIPAIPPEFREAATALQRECGNPAFHDQLAAIDPAMAARLHPNDTQRLVRAYEVMTATGTSLAAWQRMPRTGTVDGWRFRVTLVLPERDVLYDRCNRRFDDMVGAGALDEVAAFARRIADGSVSATAPVTGALGFKALCYYVEGAIPLEQAVTLAKTETRQYAKRQVTWFRHQLKQADAVAEIRHYP